MKSSHKIIVVFACLIFVTLSIHLNTNRIQNNEKDITKIIEAKGGQVDKIEEKIWGIGPFHYRSNGQKIYDVHYELGGEQKEAWVRNGPFGRDDWVWE